MRDAGTAAPRGQAGQARASSPARWAEALGLPLIGTAGGPAKCLRALGYGGAFPIDDQREDLVARVKAIMGGKGVKVVYDSIGQDTFDRRLVGSTAVC